jgi:hypothetical protein
MSLTIDAAGCCEKSTEVARGTMLRTQAATSRRRRVDGQVEYLSDRVDPSGERREI